MSVQDTFIIVMMYHTAGIPRSVQWSQSMVQIHYPRKVFIKSYTRRFIISETILMYMCTMIKLPSSSPCLSKMSTYCMVITKVSNKTYICYQENATNFKSISLGVLMYEPCKLGTFFLGNPVYIHTPAKESTPFYCLFLQ